jgi:Protein of unknown function (DUF997)
MSSPPPPPGKEQRLLRHARREGLLIMVVWAVCLVWSVGSGYFLGYHRDPDSIRLILGMPDWVFWSVVLPWALCLLFSGWFCFRYMADDDLGRDPDEGPGHG